MFDDFLPNPDAESLPFYPLVLKLVVCVSLATGGPKLGNYSLIITASITSLNPRNFSCPSGTSGRHCTETTDIFFFARVALASTRELGQQRKNCLFKVFRNLSESARTSQCTNRNAGNLEIL